MKSKTRKQILYEEAANLFMMKGYPATSIRELADRIGIEPSSIYSHIKSKEELLIKICMDAAEYFSSGMDEILEQEGDVYVKINHLVDLHIDAVFELPTSITVFNDEWKHLPDESKSEFLSIRTRYQNQWIELLKKGIHENFIKDMDPYLIKEMILSSLRWIHYLSGKNKEEKLESMRSDIKLFLFGAYAKSNNK